MSTSRYTPLATSDNEKYTGSLQFGSAFSYKDPSAFGLFDSKKKFQSIFTYAGSSPDQMTIHSVEPARSAGVERILALCVTAVCYLLWLVTFPVSAWFSFKRLQHFERIVVFRLGHLHGSKGPGVVVVLPFVDRSCKVDLRMKAFSVPPQKLLTQDGAGIEVGAEVFYRVKDPVMSITNIQDLNHSSRVIAQTVLCRQLAAKELSDIESQKAILGETLRDEINTMTLTWGVEVSKVQLSQVNVLSEPDESFRSSQNPLSLIGQLLFPSGTPNIPFGNSAVNMATSGVMGQSGMASMGQMAVPMPSLLPSKPNAQTSHSGGNMVTTPDTIIAKISPHITADLVQQLGYVYRFLEEGNQSNVFYLDLKNGNGSIGRGEPPLGEPDVTLTLSIELLNSLLSGETSPLQAYMLGDLEVDGDKTAARSLSSLANIMQI